MKSRAGSLLFIVIAALCGCSTASAPAAPPPEVIVLAPAPVWRIAQDHAGLFVVCAQCGQPSPKSAWHAQGPSASGLPPIITIPSVVLRAEVRFATAQTPHAER